MMETEIMNTFYGYVIAAILVLWLAYRAAKKAADKEAAGGSGNTAGVSTNPDRAGIYAAPPAVQQWYSVANAFALKYDIPVEVLLAQIWTESSGNPDAVGSAGEIGLMQLKQIAVDDIREAGYYSYPKWKDDPEQNIGAGAAYLHLQRKRAGSLREALGSYNQGYKGNLLAPVFGNIYEDKVLNRAKELGFYG